MKPIRLFAAVVAAAAALVLEPLTIISGRGRGRVAGTPPGDHGMTARAAPPWHLDPAEAFP